MATSISPGTEPGSAGTLPLLGLAPRLSPGPAPFTQGRALRLLTLPSRSGTLPLLGLAPRSSPGPAPFTQGQALRLLTLPSRSTKGRPTPTSRSTQLDTTAPGATSHPSIV